MCAVNKYLKKEYIIKPVNIIYKCNVKSWWLCIKQLYTVLRTGQMWLIVQSAFIITFASLRVKVRAARAFCILVSVIRLPGWPKRSRDKNLAGRGATAAAVPYVCVYVCSPSHGSVDQCTQRSLSSGETQTDTGSLVRVWNMELSAVGDRVFAAEAILKRRVRKVSNSRHRPACFDCVQMLAVGNAARHCSSP